jgi:hypothetical protein
MHFELDSGEMYCGPTTGQLDKITRTEDLWVIIEEICTDYDVVAAFDDAKGNPTV